MAGEPDAFGLKAIQHPVGESRERRSRYLSPGPQSVRIGADTVNPR